MSINQLFRKKSVKELRVEESESEHESHAGMAKVLRVRDLTFFGIAAIIGGGAFSAIGSACNLGGPAVIILFIICAVACGFTAMCYAEFAARVPFSGSAYTYAYVSFGELLAWIIGWALLMEYSIGNIYIAFSWSGYFTSLLDAMHLHMPEWLTTNYKSAHALFLHADHFNADYLTYLKNATFQFSADGGFKAWLNSDAIQHALKNGKALADLAHAQYLSLMDNEGYRAWTNAPLLGGLHLIFDLPAVVINGLITWLVYVGVRESRNFSNLMVIIKLAVIVLVIIVGFFYVDINNWSPFMPNGFGGVMAGAAGVFFAYIGFDAVSTLAEESENPQRDLPRGMIYSLIICTVAYIILSLVLTGMVTYSKFANVSDPLAFVFAIKGVKWMLFIISIAAVIAMTSVLLVFQMGQPRIWMSMSRDGLLPKRFSSLHKKYKTPAFSTVITGLVVGVPLFFTDENFVLDFTSIGTLFAFVLVCGGVLMLPRREKTPGKFHLPYFNGKFIMPVLAVAAVVVMFTVMKNDTQDFLRSRRLNDPATVAGLAAEAKQDTALRATLITQYNITPAAADTLSTAALVGKIPTEEYRNTVIKLTGESIAFTSGKDVLISNISMWAFLLVCLYMTIRSFTKNLSMIPTLGLIACCYLLTGMAASNWIWFAMWMVIGLCVYFLYSRHHSRLNPLNAGKSL